MVVVTRRAFAVAGPAAWNSLSGDLRDPVLISTGKKKGHLAAKNFIIRLLYKDTY